VPRDSLSRRSDQDAPEYCFKRTALRTRTLYSSPSAGLSNRNFVAVDEASIDATLDEV